LAGDLRKFSENGPDLPSCRCGGWGSRWKARLQVWCAQPCPWDPGILTICAQAIPVSGEGRSTRERIATPFMKDLQPKSEAHQAIINPISDQRTCKHPVITHYITHYYTDLKVQSWYDIIFIAEQWIALPWLHMSGLTPLTSCLKDDELFEDARSVHFSTEAIQGCCWSFPMWVWVNTYRYIFSGMNIYLPAILGVTRYQGFDPSPCVPSKNAINFHQRPKSYLKEPAQ